MIFYCDAHLSKHVGSMIFVLTGGAEKCRNVKTAGEDGARSPLRATVRPAPATLEETRTAAIRKAEIIFSKNISMYSLYQRERPQQGGREH